MKELIGYIGVDAGCVWVGDPCYCVTPDCDSHPAKTWSEFCKKLEDGNFFEKDFKSFGNDNVSEGIGICIATAHGDGEYPVYLKRNKDGRPSRLIINLE